MHLFCTWCFSYCFWRESEASASLLQHSWHSIDIFEKYSTQRWFCCCFMDFPILYVWYFISLWAYFTSSLVLKFSDQGNVMAWAQNMTSTWKNSTSTSYFYSAWWKMRVLSDSFPLVINQQSDSKTSSSFFFLNPEWLFLEFLFMLSDLISVISLGHTIDSKNQKKSSQNPTSVARLSCTASKDLSVQLSSQLITFTPSINLRVLFNSSCCLPRSSRGWGELWERGRHPIHFH